MEEEDGRQMLLPMEHYQVEGGENGNEPEEDPCAPMNQIVHLRVSC